MFYWIEAAAGCHNGKDRGKNEDNLFFGGRCLEQNHNGLRHSVTLKQPLNKDIIFAVFDGLGGENHGEIASFIAARILQQQSQTISDYFVSERLYLESLTQQMNQEFVQAKSIS